MPSSDSIKSMERGTTPGLGDDPMLQLTRVFVYFLQNTFRSAPEGMGMRWDPNEESTELLITAEKPILDAVEKKPHITCVFGDGEWGSLGIDQMQKQSLINGDRTHTDLIASTMTYHCQSTDGIHSRRLGWYASYFTNVFRRILIKGGGLHQVGMRHKMSAESGPTVYTGPLSREKVVSVVVTIPFYWQPQWLIKDPAHVWRQMVLNMEIGHPQARFSSGQQALIRGARIRGKPLQSVTKPADSVLTQVVKDSKFEGEE